jgi:rhodanese-related sulfurtransferase
MNGFMAALRRSWCLLVSACAASAAGLGIVAPGQEVQFDLVYEHKGPDRLVLAEAFPSCSCTTILDFPSSIAPGERVRLSGVFVSDRLGLIDSPVELRSRAGDASSAFAVLRLGGGVADANWLRSAEQASAEGLLLVDSRPEEVYARLHVFGARSIPAFALIERRELRDTPFAVYDDGIDPTAILALVAELRTAGFKQVYALRGGLAGWLRAERPVQGLLGSRVPFSSVGPARWVSLRGRGDWSLVTLGPERVADFGAEQIPDLSDLLRQVADPANADRRWVLLSADRNLYEQIEARLPAALQERLYFLAGGPSALAEQRRIAGVLSARQSYMATTGEVPRRGVVSTASHRPSSRCASCGK